MAFKNVCATDLASIFKDTGSTVSYNGFNTYGFKTYEPTDVLQLDSKHYSVNATNLTLVIATGSLGVLPNNAQVVVDGVTYLIKSPLLIGDGLETKMNLVGIG